MEKKTKKSETPAPKQQAKKKQFLLMENIYEHFKKIYEGSNFENFWYNKFISAIKVFIISTRKFLIDDCFTKASAIAYTAIISLIPALTVVLTFYSIFSGAGNKKEALFREISLLMVEHSIKLNIDPVFTAISALVDNAGKIGGIGALIMIFTATTTLRALEKSLNSIMNVQQGRTFFQKIIYYWAALTLGPVMLISGTTVATKLSNVFSSPNYNAAAIHSNQIWVVGQKSTILHKGIKGSPSFKKIEPTAIDFENQNINTYDIQSKQFIPDELPLDRLLFAKTNFKDIQFIGKKGWIVGNKGIVLTTENGGKNWRINKLGNLSFNDIEMLSELRGIIVSNNGIILNTYDGGKTWTVRDEGDVSTNYSSIAFKNGRGIITGSNGRVLLSSDGGNTWEKRILKQAKRKGQYVNLNDAMFTPRGEIWIAGNDGIILRSKNNGETWQHYKFKAYNYNTIHISANKQIYLAGENGVIISTKNKGETWSSEQLPAYSLNSIFETKNRLFAIGNSGTFQERILDKKYWSGKSGKGFLAIVINFLAPFLFIWLLFLLTYSTMPNMKIPFQYAAIGAAFTGAIWVVFILLFIIYIKAFAVGTFAIYGALASIPLFLLMIYASALIILYGAEVAYTLMHPETYKNLKRSLTYEKKINLYYGLMLLQYIYSQFESGKGAPDYSKIMKKFSHNSRDVDYFIQIFVEHNFIAVSDEGEYMPRTASSKIKLLHVFNCINETQAFFPGVAKKGTVKEEIKQIFDKLTLSRERVLKDTTLKDIIV